MTSAATGTDQVTDESASATRAEICAVACADAFRDNGEVIASAFGTIPAIGARLARLTFSPDLQISDGEAYMLRGNERVGGTPAGDIEAWTPFRTIFDLVWHGKRHVMMIPSQIDAFGNANISVIGDHARPKAQLIGVRGAPGNSVYHPTSYWVPRHSPQVFVERVDMVSGVGTDNAVAGGPAAQKHHDLRTIVTNLAVFDYADSGAVRLASVHPGVTITQVREATGFEPEQGDDVPETRQPTAEELSLIREIIDPRNLRDRELPA